MLRALYCLHATVYVQDRGGALVTAYDARIAESALATEKGRAEEVAAVTSADALWANLEYFLKAVVPVAEECGIDLALHPDDPPLPVLRGKPQVCRYRARVQPLAFWAWFTFSALNLSDFGSTCPFSYALLPLATVDHVQSRGDGAGNSAGQVGAKRALPLPGHFCICGRG